MYSQSTYRIAAQYLRDDISKLSDRIFELGMQQPENEPDIAEIKDAREAMEILQDCLLSVEGEIACIRIAADSWGPATND